MSIINSPIFCLLGVPKVAAKRGTDFAPFELKSIQRTRTSNPPTEDENEGSFSFKARPMPSYQETVSVRQYIEL